VHGVMPDGTIVRGLEVIRRAYSAVGWGWMMAPTGWPGLKWLCDRVYAWFAKNRRKWSWATTACDEGRCDV
jgi:predicted DCC family thiol-disulfide oxidoreductase YuxK